MASLRVSATKSLQPCWVEPAAGPPRAFHSRDCCLTYKTRGVSASRQKWGNIGGIPLSLTRLKFCLGPTRWMNSEVCQVPNTRCSLAWVRGRRSRWLSFLPSARPHLCPLFGGWVWMVWVVLSQTSEPVYIRFACEQGPELSNSSWGLVVLASS